MTTLNAHVTLAETSVYPSTKYTVIGKVLAAADARTCTLKVIWKKIGGTTISTVTAGSATDSTTAWTKIRGTLTSPATADYAEIELTVATVSGTTDIHYLDTVGIFPGTVETWTAGGFAGTTKLKVTRSTETTTIWSAQYPTFMVRTASTLHPATVPTPRQEVVLHTFEAVQGTEYTYTGTVISGNQHSGASTPSNAVTLKTTPQRWWELDPTNPTGAINAQVTSWQPTQVEQSAAHQVMGMTTMQIIANAMLNQDFQVTFKVFTQAIYRALHTVTTSQKTVWISSPWGDLDSGWFRIGPQPGGLSTGLGNKVRTTTLHPSLATAPYRTVSFTAVSQPRPTA